ncbi:MAG: prolipoprotein diacylglyceryl transferase family protein, partial [Planctomycetota bacterium]
GVVAFALPHAELQNVNGQPVGLAIRGYGVMLLLAVVGSVSLAYWRAQRAGIDPNAILSLAPWTFVGGIVGARLFYVIQYREQYFADSWRETLANLAAFTQGGLVVYGGLIGGFAVSILFLWRQKLPILKLGDVIVPCIFVGIMLGRLGCLMNGCCYGGRCEPSALAMEFPQGSPVYYDQMLSGDLVGISGPRSELDADISEVLVETVRPESIADRQGVKVGQSVRLAIGKIDVQAADSTLPIEDVPRELIAMMNGKTVRLSSVDLPPRAMPVRAAQLLSSLAALAACVVLLIASRFLPVDGMLLLMGCGLYAVVRFGLEWVRVDEAGQFGTELSISQWVSLIVLFISVVGVVWLSRRGPRQADSVAVVTAT